MIQRIQSIWLFLAAITILLIAIIPILSSPAPTGETWIQGSGLYTSVDGVKQKLEGFLPLMINIIAIGLLSLVNIFNFRQRTIQKRFIGVQILLTLSLILLIYGAAQKLPGGLSSASYGAGAFLPLLALIFCILAWRGIQKDEALLRSADRLR